MRRQNVLLMLSVLMNVGLVLYLFLGTGPTILVPEALGQNRASYGGGYAVASAEISNTREALYLISNAEKRMVLYAVETGRGSRVVPLGARDLREDFGENLAGDLIMVPGAVSTSSEAMYVIDPVGKRMIAYGYSGRKVEILGAREFEQDFKQ